MAFFQIGQLQLAQPAVSAKQFNTAFALCALMILTFLFVPFDVMAQTTGTGTGASGDVMWTSFKSTVFGPWGLIFAAVILFCSIYIGLRRGLGEAIIVMALGLLVFLVPALVISMMKAGQSLATGA